MDLMRLADESDSDLNLNSKGDLALLVNKLENKICALKFIQSLKESEEVDLTNRIQKNLAVLIELKQRLLFIEEHNKSIQNVKQNLG